MPIKQRTLPFLKVRSIVENILAKDDVSIESAEIRGGLNVEIKSKIGHLISVRLRGRDSIVSVCVMSQKKRCMFTARSDVGAPLQLYPVSLGMLKNPNGSDPVDGLRSILLQQLQPKPATFDRRPHQAVACPIGV